MYILDLHPDSIKLSLVNNKILRDRRSNRKALKLSNDKLFEERKNKHRDSTFIKIGEW